MAGASPRHETEPAERPPQQPVALLFGRGHVIVHANPAFLAEFGASCVGLPASEALPAWPKCIFDVTGRVLEGGRPLATWVEIGGRRHRLTVAPRRDPEDGEVYGVAIRLAAQEERKATSSLR